MKKRHRGRQVCIHIKHALLVLIFPNEFEKKQKLDVCTYQLSMLMQIGIIHYYQKNCTF